jgi:hypothetical protein
MCTEYKVVEILSPVILIKIKDLEKCGSNVLKEFSHFIVGDVLAGKAYTLA